MLLTAPDRHGEHTEAEDEDVDSDEVGEEVFRDDLCHDEERLRVVAGHEEAKRAHGDRERVVRTDNAQNQN